jgi:hypothetical protein
MWARTLHPRTKPGLLELEVTAGAGNERNRPIRRAYPIPSANSVRISLLSGQLPPPSGSRKDLTTHLHVVPNTSARPHGVLLNYLGTFFTYDVTPDRRCLALSLGRAVEIGLAYDEVEIKLRPTVSLSWCLGFAEAVTLGSNIVLSHLRLPQSGGPGTRIYIFQEEGSPVTPPGSGFPLRRLSRLVGLRWRYSKPPRV